MAAADDRRMRSLLAQACCAAGGVTGLWLGFLAELGQPGSAGARGALTDVLLPVGWRVVAGVLAGAGVAWLLNATVLRARPPAR
jgi:hypothetical protein